MHATLLYDGDCGFCQRSVRFVFARDPHARIGFAALQSEVGRRLLRAHGLPEDKSDSLVLVHDGRAHERSTGALLAGRLLRWPWSWLARLGLLVPRRARDWAYDQIARRRHALLHGRACPMPSAELRARFLDARESQR